jgi:rhodanese-related sulfurtransferase
MGRQWMDWRALVGLVTGSLLLVTGALAARADDLMSPAMTPAEVEFGIAHLPGAVNIPVKELEKRLAEVQPAKGQDLLIYCLDGNRTREAEPVLYAHNIDNFYHLQGSLEGWISKHYPIEKGGVKKTTW